MNPPQMGVNPQSLQASALSVMAPQSEIHLLLHIQHFIQTEMLQKVQTVQELYRSLYDNPKREIKSGTKCMVHYWCMIESILT